MRHNPFAREIVRDLGDGWSVVVKPRTHLQKPSGESMFIAWASVCLVAALFALALALGVWMGVVK